MPDEVVRVRFVTEFAVPAVRPSRRRPVTAQKVKGWRCDARLYAGCRNAAKTIERVSMKNPDRILRISSVAVFTNSGAANSFHRVEVSPALKRGQRPTRIDRDYRPNK